MKTLTRIKSGLTGEEYYIGTAGDSEVVVVELTSNDTVAWENYKVTLYDTATKETQQQVLSAEGIAKFTVPYTHQYTLTLPTISGYPTPAVLTYTATNLLTTRYVKHNYFMSYEQVDINCVLLSTTGDDYGILEGQKVYARVNGENTYEATFGSDGKATIEAIPYGTSYTLIFPEIEGYMHDHTADTYVAGVISREILVHYSSGDLGMFAIDADGNHYAYATLKTGIEDSTITADSIIAIGFNNITLQGLDRGDGTTGCGFCIGVGSVVSKKWADEAIAFNPNKLPYLTSHSAAMLACTGGKHNTELIKEIGDAGECGTWTYDSATQTYIAGEGTNICDIPAVNYCLSQSLTMNGVKRTGFLPSYAQIYYLSLNLTTLQAFFTLLGKTAPTITSGYWWTSCQNSSTYAVGLGNGSFDGHINKTTSLSVLVCYDL